MRLNQSHPYVTLITNVPAEQVKSIYLGGNSDQSGSQMHTFTKDICDAFPKLEIIEGNNLGLQKIMEKAFDNCSKTTEIRLSNNFLAEFVTKEWERNKILTTLYLDGNKLRDINPQEVDRTFPGLSKIMLKRNNITDQRYKELVEEFKKLKVTME